MKASELMLNDWVLHKGIAKRVNVIWSDHSVSLYDPNRIWGSIYADRHETSEISPIPLTTDILEQNGWFFANGVWVLKSSTRLGWNPRTKELITGYYTFPATIEYVHQLQILMRMLGVKETIKL